MATHDRLEYDGVSHLPWSAPSLSGLTAAHSGMPETSLWDELTREQQRHVRHPFLVTTGETDSDGLPGDFGRLKLPPRDAEPQLSEEGWTPPTPG